MGSITSEELQRLREVFASCDPDGDGCVDEDGFMQLIGTLDAKLTAAEVHQAFHHLDTDSSGLLEFGEFADWWAGLPDHVEPQ